MADKKIISGIDVGTTKIVAIIAEYDEDNNISIIGLGESKSTGLERGVIVNVKQTIESLQTAITQAESQCEYKIESVYVGISGDHIKGGNGSGVVSVSDFNSNSIGKVITKDDKEKVLENAKSINISSDRRILHVLSQHFNIDDRPAIKDPEGLTGSRLEAKVHLVTSSKITEKDFETCFDELDIDVQGFVLEPLASSYSILDSDEKKLGSIMLDIGGGTTDMVIYKNGGIVHTHIVPLGGESITNDIAFGLKCKIATAEKLKTEYGSAIELAEDREIAVEGINNQEKSIFTSNDISNIIQPRISEIFRRARFEIDTQISMKQIPFGIILTGGGSKLKNITDIAENIFECKVRIGIPNEIKTIDNKIFNPKYSTAIGLVHYAIDNKDSLELYQKNSVGGFFKNIFLNIKDLFNN